MFTRLRFAIILCLFVALNVYGQDDYDYWMIEQNTPDWALTMFKDLRLSDSLNISDFINPFYFEEDFNGDSNLDIAMLVEHKGTLKKGILFLHGSSKNYFLLGANVIFSGSIDDFSWMDSWEIFRSNKFYELTYDENFDISGTREISVHTPCIEATKLESAGGLIYWDGQKYKWAQTSD